MSFTDFWETLNESQQIGAGAWQSGHAAVAGAPGGGKTRTLIATIGDAVRQGVQPQRILAMTFTRAAAAEIQSRLEALGFDGVQVGTIHAIANRMRRKYAASCDLSDVQVDESGLLILDLKQCLTQMRIEDKRCRRVTFDKVQKLVSDAKSCGIAHMLPDIGGLNVVLRKARYNWCRRYRDTPNWFSEDLLTRYSSARANHKLIDYDDMQLICWRLLTNARVRECEQGQYDLILVDEAQDSSPVQWDVARLLAGLPSCILGVPGGATDGFTLPEEYAHVVPTALPPEQQKPLVVFGQPEQSLYAWRGAVPEYFVSYAQQPDVRLVQLNDNYRSVPGVCITASKLVEGQPWEITGAIRPVREGDPIETAPVLKRTGGLDVEISDAIDLCERLATDGSTLSECALLCRTSVSLDLAEIECIHRDIKYRKMGGSSSFLQSKVCRDLLGYLRVSMMHASAGPETVRRCVNAPFRFISKRWLDDCEHAALTGEINMHEVVVTRGKEMPQPARRNIQEYADLIRHLNRYGIKAMQIGQEAGVPQYGEEAKRLSEERRVGPLYMLRSILRETDYLSRVADDEGMEKDALRSAICEQLKTLASEFICPIAFIDYIDALAQYLKQKPHLKRRPNERQDDVLTLATIHAAKGLEWGHVQIIDVSEGVFPHHKNVRQDEELRLLYVAVTRAKHTLVISSSNPSEYFKRLAEVIPGYGEDSASSSDAGTDDTPVVEDRPDSIAFF